MNANNANKSYGKLIYPELSYKSIIRILRGVGCFHPTLSTRNKIGELLC